MDGWMDGLIANSRSLVTRVNGKYDRYCGSVEIARNTPCHHLVIPTANDTAVGKSSSRGGDVEQTRWLVFPERKYCCACCTSAQGCGIVSPDWMSNATYEGQVEYNGFSTYKWNAKGLQPNYYYETVDGSVPVALDQVPDDNQDFDPASFSTDPIDDSLFQLPEYCSGSCWGSIVCDLI